MAAAALGLAACSRPPTAEPARAPEKQPPPPDASPFAKVRCENGSWFIELDGRPLACLGVNVVQPRESAPRNPDLAYNALEKFQGDRAAWARSAMARLVSWGFDTAGAWCDEALYEVEMPHVRVAWLGGYSGHGQRADTRLVDVWEPSYADAIEEQAAKQVAPYSSHTRLLGFFVNNELPFYGEFPWPTDPDKSLWDVYMALPPGAPGKKEAAAFFVKYYGGDIGRAGRDWNIESFEQLAAGPPPGPKTPGAQRLKHAWAGHVADRYYALCHSAIRRHAPSHLILGSRHAGRPPADVVRAEAKYADVISINHYAPGGHPDLAMLRNLHALTGRPILITEFSWRAVENRSGNTNARGAEVTVATQRDRAAAYESYVGEWMREPYAVGAHWFQYHDQPPDGRSFDGENSNYGIVDIRDEPYQELVEAMRRANIAVAKGLHSRPGPPGGFRFDPVTWGELVPVSVVGPPLDSPVPVDPALGPATIKADAGNSGRVAVENGVLTISYSTGGGWGLHSDSPLPQLPAGAQNVVLRVRGTAGHKYRLFLSEHGCGPPGRQTYEGRAGADGESFEFPPFTATGGVEDIIIPLETAAVRQYWGNQRGDRRLCSSGLASYSLFVYPGQGSGEIEILSFEFTP